MRYRRSNAFVGSYGRTSLTATGWGSSAAPARASRAPLRNDGGARGTSRRSGRRRLPDARILHFVEAYHHFLLLLLRLLYRQLLQRFGRNIPLLLFYLLLLLLLLQLLLLLL
ncbi:MAG: hypothetical protein LBH84_05335, partial [Prevotellaceae bacterium]|nr:hypothetical protein [Prevotellaceae bacterium]